MFSLCLTFSVELMAWGSLSSVIWRPSSPFTICVAIIAEPIKCISFKFQMYIALDMTQVEFYHFEKKAFYDFFV